LYNETLFYQRFATTVQSIRTRWGKRYCNYSFSNKHFFFYYYKVC